MQTKEDMSWYVKICRLCHEKTGEKPSIHPKSDSQEIMIVNDRWNNSRIFISLLNRYQVGLEKSIKGKYYEFDYAEALHYKCHK